MIFDTHAHYEDRAFDADREALIQSLPVRGISPVVDVGSSLATSREALALADRVGFFYAAVGLHPDAAEEASEDTIRELERLARDPKVVAVGEIGLDYHWPDPPRDVQKRAFSMQLDMAARLRLPVIIHSRDAEKDTEDILRAWGVPVNTVLLLLVFAGERSHLRRNGAVLWHRRCADIQKDEKTEGSGEAPSC